MRTTITLDDDVAAKLKSVARETGRSFKETVNELLRIGLASQREPQQHGPFKVQARDLGELQPGVSLDNIGELLERVEGPLHR